ncbi:MAG: flagellar motor protein MotB [Oscillospiraceae bacterium]
MTRKPQEPINDQEWLNTYADMVTLLLTFFILLFSMSSVDSAKLQALVMAFVERGGVSPVVASDSIGGGVDGSDPSAGGVSSGKAPAPQAGEGMPQDMEELYQYLKSYIEEGNLQSSVEISKSDNQIYLRFNNNIFFDADSDFLRNDGKAILDFMGNGFKSVMNQILMIRVNGHTAAVPNAPNYHVNDRILSSDRANAVAIYLEEVKELDSKKIMSQGYGKNFPVDTNDTPEGRERNRRVEIMILGTNDGQSIDAMTTEQLYDMLMQEFDVTMESDLSGLIVPGSEGAGKIPTDKIPNIAGETAPTDKNENPAETKPTADTKPPGLTVNFEPLPPNAVVQGPLPPAMG